MQEEVFALYHNKIENYIYFNVSDRNLAEDIAYAKIIHAKAISSLRESMGIDNYLI